MNILIIREKSIKLFKISQNLLLKLQFLIILIKIDYYIILILKCCLNAHPLIAQTSCFGPDPVHLNKNKCTCIFLTFGLVVISDSYFKLALFYSILILFDNNSLNCKTCTENWV